MSHVLFIPSGLIIDITDHKINGLLNRDNIIKAAVPSKDTKEKNLLNLSWSVKYDSWILNDNKLELFQRVL